MLTVELTKDQCDALSEVVLPCVYHPVVIK